MVHVHEGITRVGSVSRGAMISQLIVSQNPFGSTLQSVLLVKVTPLVACCIMLKDGSNAVFDPRSRCFSQSATHLTLDGWTHNGAGGGGSEIFTQT